ncbi:hypothetical protein SNK04_006347 [Fusarium graminearum]
MTTTDLEQEPVWNKALSTPKEDETNSLPTEKLNSTADCEAAVHQDTADTRIQQGDDVYLHGPPLVLMTLSLMVGVLMISLDTSIIATAIPKITSKFDSLGDVGVFCGAMIIISRIVEMRKRPLLLAIVATLGALMAAIIVLYYPLSLGEAPNKDKPIKEKILGLGLRSSALLAGTLVCLFLALQNGGSVYPWSDSRVWGCLLGFGLLLVLFTYIQIRQGEARHDYADVPFALYFQAVKGVNPQVSGINILPHGVTTTVATLIAGSIITWLGYYVPFMWIGSAIFTTGAGLLYTIDQGTPLAQWFGFEVLAGAGFGMAIQIPVSAVQVVLSTTDIPLGTVLVIISQALGGSVGLSISQNVFQNSLRQRLKDISGIDVGAVIAVGGIDLEHIVPSEKLSYVRNAFRYGVSNAFIVSTSLAGAAFLASIGMERRKIKSKKDRRI